MMGRSHALTGCLAGLAAAPLLVHTPGEVVGFAVAAGGYALLPDLDHPGSTASRIAGPFTEAICWLLRHASAFAYRHTKGPRDERSKGTHRHLSHTLAFALALGGLVVAATWVAGLFSPVAGAATVAAVYAVGVVLAMAVLGDWVLLPAGFTACVWLAANYTHLAASVTGLVGPVGVAVALGCLVHCLGDMITESGCPILWPGLIAGETWYELRPPAWLRFTTGGWVENLLVAPASVAGIVLLAPGLGPFVRDHLAILLNH